ncbi:MAG: Mu-like prophage major head subunit gpT family protein [Anaerolineae bacterium]
MLVNRDLLAATYTNLRAVYMQSFEAAENAEEWRRLAMEIPSTTLTETYEWLGTVPIMTEWVDERKVGDLKANSFSLTNKHFEATVAVDRNILEDDRLGMIRPRVMQLGEEAARYPRSLVTDAIVAGTSSLGYDGKALFANDHRTTGGDNLLGGAGVTVANLQTDITQTWGVMREFTDDRGRVMNVAPDLVVVPAELEFPMKTALQAAVISSTDNIYKGLADIMVCPELTDATDWYAFCTKRSMRALIYQNRKAPEFVSLDSPDDYANFMRRQLVYGVDARCVVGVGIWWYACKVVNG